MNIVHISDIHFRKEYRSADNGYQEMLTRMQSPLVSLEKCLTRILQQTEIDLLVISGDLTEDGDVEDYRFLKEWLQQIIGKTEILVTLGNHDIKTNFRMGWCEEEPSYLPYNQVLDYPDFTIISFDNSCHGEADGVADIAQFKWLQRTLTRLGDRPIIIVTHHHLLTQQSSMPPWPGTEMFLKLIASYNIRCIFNGHTHHTFLGTVQEIPYYTAASMSFIGEDEGNGMIRFEEAYGYNLYCFDGDRLVHQVTENFKPGILLTTLQMS